MNKECEHRYKNECNDKNSTYYFMCHMTQKEYEERLGNKQPIKDFKFNIIQPERPTPETFCTEMLFKRMQLDIAIAEAQLAKRCDGLNTMET